jgi:hypothetical protein
MSSLRTDDLETGLAEFETGLAELQNDLRDAAKKRQRTK